MRDNSLPYIVVTGLFLLIAGYNVWFGTTYKQGQTESFYEKNDPDRYEFYNNQIIPPTK